MNPAPDDAATLHVTQRLSKGFPTVEPDVVLGIVRDTHRRFAGHPTPDAIPMLVEETARDRLRGHLEASRRQGLSES